MTDLLADLVLAFTDKRAVFFIAAGCSTPSLIPSASKLAEQVALRAYAGQSGTTFEGFKIECFGETEPTLDKVADYFYQKDGRSIEGFARLVPFAEWRGRVPNEAHQAVIRLAMEGFYDKAITTNWDTLIEAAASQLGCSIAVVRQAEDLYTSVDADLQLFKIHGCLSQLPSLIAATSQWDEETCLWAQPQTEAAFHGSTVVFAGYSGSIETISRSMERIAKWAPADVKHVVVDVMSWESFEQSAAEFVNAANVDESQYDGRGAVHFFSELLNRLIRLLVLETLSREAERQHSAIIELKARDQPEDYTPPAQFVERIANSEGADLLLRTLLTAVGAYQPVNRNAALLGRVVAWVAYLSARGWNNVDGLPLMTNESGEWIYLAAGDLGAPASKVARRVSEVLASKADLRRLVLGRGERAVVTCIILAAAGSARDLGSNGLLADTARPDDLIQGGRSPLVFRTEAEFLEEAG